MAESLVLSAALQTAFDQLFISVVHATEKVARFTMDLNRLKSTLSSIKPAIGDVERFNKILDRPLHETEALTLRLIQGENLIRKCSTVKYWNVFMRLYYANKISKLETLLIKFFQINVAALHFRETKRISVVVSNLEEKVNEITTMLRRNEIGSKCLSDEIDVVEIQQSGDQENEGMLF